MNLFNQIYTEILHTPGIVKFEHVGSRVTCCPPPMDTDDDWLLLINNKFSPLQAELWALGGSNLPKDKFTSFSEVLGDKNLIITKDIEFYDKFVKATMLCRNLNLMQKPDRICLFQAILYNNYGAPL
jgi:hypothetical protein